MPSVSFTLRYVLWCYVTLLPDLDIHDFRNYMRVNSSTYDNLLNRIKPLIQRETTNFDIPVSPALAAQCLPICLRCLAA